jgi:predicted nuclease of predicted toxin-antitoxin system
MMPRFLADECFSGPVFRALLAAGFDIVRSSKALPSADDETVLAAAFEEGRVLLTEDTDFGKLTVQLGAPSMGLVRVVLKNMSKEARCERTIKVLRDLGDRVLNSITVIEANKVRIRSL